MEKRARLAILLSPMASQKLVIRAGNLFWRAPFGAAWALGWLILAGLSAFSGSASAATQEHTLSNGLRIIVREDHRSPAVVSMVWYKAGSMDEFNGTTGVAHVLEHLMFKGTKTVPAGEFSRIIAAAGGRENAFTGHDYTAYFQQLQNSKLPLALKLEADRMVNLTLSREEFGKEIKVVMEERRLRTDDQPHALLEEQLRANAFESSPYRVPVIGWMNDLENMRVADARNWYRSWYAPNNALLVVVGDVESKAVFALAQRYFGGIRPRPLPLRKPQAEPRQDGIKRVSVKAPARLPYLLMGYHVPVLRDADRDWEPYALEILAGILDGYDAARLNRDLVREGRLAASVGASYDSVSRGPGMFILEGTPSQDKSVREIEAGLRGELAKVADAGVGEDELQRVKAQVAASHVFRRDSMFYQALLIGSLEMAGLSYRSMDRQVSKLRAVTAAQVQEVARRYFKDDNLTVAVLDPQPLPEGKPAPRPRGTDHVR